MVPNDSDDAPTRRTGTGPDHPGGWLALSIVVAVLAFGLLSLRTLGLGLLGTRGLLAVFLLAEALGVGGLIFVGRSMSRARCGAVEEAADDLAIGRRWALSGMVFIVGMAAVTGLARLLPYAVTA